MNNAIESKDKQCEIKDKPYVEDKETRIQTYKKQISEVEDPAVIEALNDLKDAADVGDFEGTMVKLNTL